MAGLAVDQTTKNLAEEKAVKRRREKERDRESVRVERADRQGKCELLGGGCLLHVVL